MHLIAELRELGYKLAVGWVSRPYAKSDISIVGCYLAAAGDTGRDGTDVAALQQWRRRHDVMWASELPRTDGRTLKHRFGHDLQRRIGNCEDDALRLCSICFRQWTQVSFCALESGPSVACGVGRSAGGRLHLARRRTVRSATAEELDGFAHDVWLFGGHGGEP